MEERIDLVAVEEEPKRRGISFAVGSSFVFHLLLIIWVAAHYHPVGEAQKTPQQTMRYVELLKQPPKEFVEAPGKKTDKVLPNASPSDANRKATMPKPTGNTPTTRPGNGGLFTPPQRPTGDKRPPMQSQRPTPQMAQQQPTPSQDAQPDTPSDTPPPQHADTFRYRTTQANAAAGKIDWNNAIQKAGASMGGGDYGPDLRQGGGGDKGYAENGDVSFETKSFDWGDYAQGMISRIRVNWYNNMPDLIKTGMKGFVVIRFTIHRSGQITDVTVLKPSGVPPFDFAAQKAIELSSPLNQLPPEFPYESEHVTVGFYYNLQPPNHR